MLYPLSYEGVGRHECRREIEERTKVVLVDARVSDVTATSYTL
jgi:hypothetical protein